MTLEDRIRQMADRPDGVVVDEVVPYASNRNSATATMSRMKARGELRSCPIDTPRTGTGRRQHVYVSAK